MMKFDRKVWLPTVVTLALYAIVSILYFAPQFSGKEIVQSDIVQYKGMAQEIFESRERTGEDPQWSGSLFGGMPAYMIQIKYPSMIIKNSLRVVTDLIPAPAAYIFFAMVAMWLMLIMMGMNMWVAMVGGLMYGLSTYFFLIIDAGHITKMWALIYAPLMFGGGYMALRGSMWIGGSLLALFTSLEVGANHPQISYYFLLALAAFWLSEGIFAQRQKRLKDFAKRTAVMIVAGLVAVGSSFAPLWYAYDHTADTMRGGSVLVGEEHEQSSGNGLNLDYATAWSYGRLESFNMLIPDFMGRDSGNTFSSDGAVAQSLKPYQAEHIAQQISTYWGDQPFTGGPTYLGAVVLFLAILGFCLSDGRQRWWIVGISMFMLCLSWGRNFMWFTELMFKIMPGYNKFRTVSMTLTVVEWTAPLLAAIGLSKAWEGGLTNKQINFSVGWAKALTAGVALLFILLGRTLLGFDEEGAVRMLVDASFPDKLASQVAAAMAEERYSIMAADAWRTIILVAAAATTVWLSLKGFIKRGVMIAIISALVIFDLAGVGTRFLSYDTFKSPSENRILQPTAVNRKIWEDKEIGFRVFNLTANPFNDAITSYFHRSVGGYHAAKLSRYQDLIENYLSLQNSGVLDMLNTKYLIVPTQDGGKQVIPRPTANGAAWFVDNIVTASSPRQEMDMLGQIDTRTTAVVESREGVSPTSFGRGEIKLVEYEPHRLKYNYSLTEDGVAIFSEIYYNKGWSVTIDGVEAPYFRADYLLRAMELPAGEHQVVWEFRAPGWGLTGGITLSFSLIIIVSLIAALIYERGQKIKA
ncbi:MAG: YfhO family protein [Rikenellaceae bacterium]